MVEAICIRCGEGKTYPWKKCSFCGLDPNLNDDLIIKSVYLSEGRFDEEDDRILYREYLKNISLKIKNGQEFIFNKRELDRLRDQRRIIMNIKWYSPWIVVFRVLLKVGIWTFLTSILISVIIKAL